MPMRSFKVHDNRGQYLHCMAYGRHVDNKIVTVGNDIGIFFGNAQSGLNGNAGSFWLYNDAHVVFFGAGCTVLKEVVGVDLR